MKWFDTAERLPEDGWCLIRFSDRCVHGGWLSIDSWQECGATVFEYRLYDGPKSTDYVGLDSASMASWMPVEGPHPCREMGWALRGKGFGRC